MTKSKPAPGAADAQAAKAATRAAAKALIDSVFREVFGPRGQRTLQ
jgi:hypothetical protein